MDARDLGSRVSGLGSFQMRHRISIRGSVHPSVHPLRHASSNITQRTHRVARPGLLSFHSFFRKGAMNISYEEIHTRKMM